MNVPKRIITNKLYADFMSKVKFRRFKKRAAEEERVRTEVREYIKNQSQE
jgi:hypothetical protein